MPHLARVGRSASRRTSAFGSNYENCRTLRKAADVCGSGPGWNIDSLTSPPARDRRRVTGDFARISLISDALPPSKTLKPFIGSQPRVLEPLRDEFNMFAALGYAGDSAYKWMQSYGGPLSLNPQGNNVGIGTSTPTAKLEVVGGDLRVSGNIFANGQLVGQQGPPGPPVHTSAACQSGPAASIGCRCSGRIVSSQSSPAVDGAGCSASSDTGSCSASSRSAGSVASVCCVCAP